MKSFFLITVFLVAVTTKLLAQQKSAIEIKGMDKQPFGTIENGEQISKKDNHQFQIVANEGIDINLNFKLKTEDDLNILITDKKDKVVFSKKIQKNAENKIAFTMEENEKYTVKLAGNNQSSLTVNVSEN